MAECTDADVLLDLAIDYAMKGIYEDRLSKDKRAVRKKAKTLVIDRGEVYIRKKKGNVSQLEKYGGVS